MVNIAGANEDLAPLGKRATISAKLSDFPYHDRLTDKYAAERVSGAAQFDGIGYRPEDYGTFFTRLRARWPFYAGRPIRHCLGHLDSGSLVTAFTRHFIITDMLVDADGGVTIEGKDTCVGARGQNAFLIQAPRMHLNGCRAVSEKQYYSEKRGSLTVGQTVLTVAYGTETNASGLNLVVLKNGAALTLTTHYTISATAITLTTPAVTGDEFVVIFPPLRAVRVVENYCCINGGGADLWVPNGVSYFSDEYRFSGLNIGFLWEGRPALSQFPDSMTAVLSAVGAGNVDLQLQGKDSTSIARVSRAAMSNVPTATTGLPAGRVWNDSGDLKIV